jgi:outer membrane receptor protein involved in Fe transport
VGAAVFAVALLCAQVETGTIATATGAVGLSETSTRGDPLDALLAGIGEDPLTTAELELLEKLATATVARTASIAWPAPEELVRPAFRSTQERRRETIARSTREALEAMALPAISFRGARARVLYEGLLLVPLAEGVLDADVRMFDRVDVSTSGSRRDHSSGGGTIALYGPSPQAGIHPEAAIEARSADRSTGSFAAVEGGIPIVRARGAIGYDDTRALRTPGGAELRNAGQRWLASVRAELFGREGDLFSLSLGGDLDRAHNTRIVEDGALRGVAGLDQRALAFARATLASKTWGVSLAGGYQGLRQNIVFDEVAPLDQHADHFQGRLSAFTMPLEWLRFDAGGHLSYGSGSMDLARREVEGYVFGSILSEWISAEVGLRVAHQHQPDDQVPITATRPLPQVALHVPIVGPLGLRASFDMGMTVPDKTGIFAPAGRSFDPETSTSFEVGPTLRGGTYWIVLTGFVSWIDDPLSLVPMIDARRPLALRVLGVELDGAFTVIDGLDVAFTASLSEAVDRDTGRAVYTLPVLSGLLALRHRFDFQNAHVELHARAATQPFTLIGDEPMEEWTIAGERPRAFVRAGITGGLDLAAGFALDLSVENAFDRRYRLHTTELRGGGIDVRAALSWRW